LIKLPSVIEQYWYAFDWDVEALWARDLPVESFPIARLEWHLDVPVWPIEEQRYQMTPRQVLKSPYRYEKEYRRARTANLIFPLKITWFRRRWLILDGVHRLLKAHENGLEEVMARKHPPNSFGGQRIAYSAAR
jgi:hypothetical protein